MKFAVLLCRPAGLAQPPQDVEKEILIEQERYLRSLPNLQRMVSFAELGRARIELEFPFGTNVNDALIRVNNALSQVPSYPENVDQPPACFPALFPVTRLCSSYCSRWKATP